MSFAHRGAIYRRPKFFYENSEGLKAYTTYSIKLTGANILSAACTWFVCRDRIVVIFGINVVLIGLFIHIILVEQILEIYIILLLVNENMNPTKSKQM